MIIYSKAGKGHEVVTENSKQVAMEMFAKGYKFWENVGDETKIELGQSVNPEDVSDEKNYFAMSPMAGG